jgi:putative ABC transport system substrate-binding protein
MPNRREFLCGAFAASAVPRVAQAQQAVKTGHHIGFLPAGTSSFHRQQLKALTDGLREMGYVPGKTIVITALWPKTPSELPELAASLVQQNVELVVAPSSPAVTALQRVTKTLPIVFATAADPVGSGFVASLARPEGNITGLSILNTDLSGKRVELLYEASPSRKAVVLWLLPDDAPEADTLLTILRETERRRRALGVELRLLKVARVEDLAPAFVGLDPRQDGGLIVLPSPLAFAHASTIAELALKQKLAAVGDVRDFGEAGGLMAYGVDFDDQLRRAAVYVDRLLKGARPGDLPVQQPSKFQLVINMRTARALGLTIPPSLLARADRLIE